MFLSGPSSVIYFSTIDAVYKVDTSRRCHKICNGNSIEFAHPALLWPSFKIADIESPTNRAWTWAISGGKTMMLNLKTGEMRPFHNTPLHPLFTPSSGCTLASDEPLKNLFVVDWSRPATAEATARPGILRTGPVNFLRPLDQPSHYAL